MVALGFAWKTASRNDFFQQSLSNFFFQIANWIAKDVATEVEHSRCSTSGLRLLLHVIGAFLSSRVNIKAIFLKKDILKAFYFTNEPLDWICLIYKSTIRESAETHQGHQGSYCILSLCYGCVRTQSPCYIQSRWTYIVIIKEQVS